ncbi:LysE family translocator [Acinetobacter zhairhuonensis]|jgi:threonine/homoserine/homoserine lactone efflux protein|uniref:LysE family translocator n=1 Tax=Acinetobacter sp. A7.4 TaxID=2919921 RepID=UPI001F4F320D|nr:LysE family translocator [Acinetobacter sp. A7.4]MCJ8162043.1 LysE family translocator [Acinetobacter sp. A7.4]
MSVYLLFALTVLPLVFTPGPDMLFIFSQVMAKGAKAGMMATLGVCMGYVVHSVLVAVGIAAILVSFPMLFETIRWLGIAYLLYLAFSLLKSVFNSKALHVPKAAAGNPIAKGFLTALLNPKGMLIYFAILPQFIRQAENTVTQGLILSSIFIGLCLVVYSGLSFVIAKITANAQLDAKKQKWIDAGSGGLLMLAATWLIAN